MRMFHWIAAAVAMSALAVVASGDRAAAQQGQGRYLSEATQRLSKLIAKANQDGFQFDENTFSAGGGWLTQDKNKWVALYTLNLQAGKKYRFIAAGDADAQDIDLDVSDPNSKVVASDTSTAPEAIVNYSPVATGKHLVRLRLYASENNVPCFCLGIVMVQKQ